jgi:hypothetical protein
MNLQNFVDVNALKAKVAEMADVQSGHVDSHPDGKALPADHAHRKVSPERVRVLVNEAVNAAHKDIIAAIKDEVFEQVVAQ